MVKGRKPLPDEVKKFRGTDQPCRMHPAVKGTIISDLQVVLSHPLTSVLCNDRQWRIFSEKVNFLIGLKMMEEVYIESLLIYAINVDKYFECIDQVNKQGMVITVQTTKGVEQQENPYYKASKRAFEVASRIGSEFGFTPVSRMKLSVGDGKESPSAFLSKLIIG